MIPPKVRATVLRRADGCCERCGKPLDPWLYSLQHRAARGMGGTKRPETNQPPNLAALCGSATSPEGCHQWVESHPEAATDGGWRVPSWWPNPGTVPIHHWELGPVYLTADGGYEATEGAA